MPEWTFEEVGWYTHPTYGGICHERDGWYFYPLDMKESKVGPYKTLKAAQSKAEGVYNKMRESLKCGLQSRVS